MHRLPPAGWWLAAVAARLVPRRQFTERGDVAEKIVIVGVFVALAVTVGALITHAVSIDAGNITDQIIKAK